MLPKCTSAKSSHYFTSIVSTKATNERSAQWLRGWLAAQDETAASLLLTAARDERARPFLIYPSAVRPRDCSRNNRIYAVDKLQRRRRGPEEAEEAECAAWTARKECLGTGWRGTTRITERSNGGGRATLYIISYRWHRESPRALWCAALCSAGQAPRPPVSTLCDPLYFPLYFPPAPSRPFSVLLSTLHLCKSVPLLFYTVL